MQSVMLLAAILVIYDGFTGAPIAPRNLAGVAPWVQWRGFTAISLLVAGSLFCLACPFMLVRRVAKRFFPASRVWPARFQGKWIAAGLMVAYFWFYEAFDPWALPRLTATLVLTYFAAAFVVDGIFRGAAFCKYLCPIGQFNFLNSVCSPLEVRIHGIDVCRSCPTKDCIVGRAGGARGRVGDGESGRGGNDERLEAQPSVLSPQSSTRHTASRRQNGCELFLFQEQKHGNLDCTFCLDCVHACPYDNVGVYSRLPARELWENRRRPSIGLLENRPDFAFLALILVSGAFMNAFGMVGPFYGFESWLMSALGISSEWLALAIVFGVGLALVPVVLVSGAAWSTRALSGMGDSVRSLAVWFSYSLLPLGFGMWAAHYGYHFLTGALTLIPVTQSFLIDVGIPVLGSPRWDLAPIVPESWILPIELGLLEAGLLGSIVAAHRMALARYGDDRTARLAFLPWVVLSVALFGAGVWLLLQPMEMRGMISS